MFQVIFTHRMKYLQKNKKNWDQEMSLTDMSYPGIEKFHDWDLG